jgi:hypothetical protein
MGMAANDRVIGERVIEGRRSRPRPVTVSVSQARAMAVRRKKTIPRRAGRGRRRRTCQTMKLIDRILRAGETANDSVGSGSREPLHGQSSFRGRIVSTAKGVRKGVSAFWVVTGVNCRCQLPSAGEKGEGCLDRFQGKFSSAPSENREYLQGQRSGLASQGGGLRRHAKFCRCLPA